MKQEWRMVPIGIDAQHWLTRNGCRTVLMVVHTVVAGQRLLDLVDLIESDRRVQVVYTQAPDVFGDGVGDLLRSIGALEISWTQATRETFDLALAAAYGGLDQVHAPIMVLSHGAGHGKRIGGTNTAYGLDAQRLTRDGRVIPAVIVLSHDTQREVLARQCPQALDFAMVAGDPCYDRLRASVPFREDYRWALGVRPGRRLVLLTSTWGPHSLFARYERYLPSLLRQLDPARYQLAALIHPAVWFGHGRRQVRAWLADARAAGLTLLEPEVDWRAAAIACDYVIGDHGSSTVYAAAIGKPVLCTDLPLEDIDPASPHALLDGTPRLIRSRPLEPQLRSAMAGRGPAAHSELAARVTSRPGQAHRLLRSKMYRLLDMSMPGRHRAADPVEVPKLRERWAQ